MLHKQRTWTVAEVLSPEDLAEKLTQHTWCCCNAFRLQGYIFANDSTCEDGAQEYGILRPDTDGPDLVQIESITFSWCTFGSALKLIRQVIAGDFDAERYSRVQRDRIQTPEEHGRCQFCA